MRPASSSNLSVTLAAAALALAATHSGCLRESPYTPPGRVYDAREAMARSRLDGLDSVAVLLVSEADSARTLELWGGPPERIAESPVHVAPEGEKYYFVVRGFRDGLGLCRTETIRDGVAFLVKDACDPAQRAEFAASLIDFGDTTLSLAAEIRPLNGYAGLLEVRPRQPWIRAGADTVRLAAGAAPARIAVTVSREFLVPGGHAGTVHLWGAGVLVDSLEIRVANPSVRIFEQDSIDLGAEALEIRLPFRRPYGTLPDPFLRLVGEGVRVQEEVPSPGRLQTLALYTYRDGLRPGRKRATLYALGPGSRPLDSLAVRLIVEPAAGQLAGTVADWRSGAPLPGTEVGLFRGIDRRATSRTDSTGYFEFTGLDSGYYDLEAAPAGRLTGGYSLAHVAGKGELVAIKVPPPVALRPVEWDWGRAEAGPVAWSFNTLLIASHGSANEIIIHPVRRPGETRRLPVTPHAEGRPFELIVMQDQTAFASYPDDSVVVALRDWAASPRLESLRLPCRPYGLGQYGLSIFAACPQGDRMVVARIWANDLVLEALDTLPATHLGMKLGWSGAGPVSPGAGPRICGRHVASYFLLAGQMGDQLALALDSPISGSGWTHRTLWPAPTAGLSDVSCVNGSPSLHASPSGLHVHRQENLREQRLPYPTVKEAVRVVTADEGALTGYAFVTGRTDTLVVLCTRVEREAGRMAIPGGRPGRWLALENATGLVAVSDGHRAFWMDF